MYSPLVAVQRSVVMDPEPIFWLFRRNPCFLVFACIYLLPGPKPAEKRNQNFTAVSNILNYADNAPKPLTNVRIIPIDLSDMSHRQHGTTL